MLPLCYVKHLGAILILCGLSYMTDAILQRNPNIGLQFIVNGGAKNRFSIFLHSNRLSI